MVENSYSSLPLPTVLLSVFSVTCSQQWSKTIKWKIPEIIHKFKIVCHSE